MNSELRCPPYVAPQPYRRRDDGTPPTILDLASRLNRAANAYRDAMNQRAPFEQTLRASGHMARCADDLTTAIADAVAEGTGVVTLDRN